MTYFESFDTTRYLFLRFLAFHYLIAYLIAANQFVALCGEKGLLPTSGFVKRNPFKSIPSLFYFIPKDWAFKLAAYLGVALSVFALSGLSDQYGFTVYCLTWFLLWLFYLSFVNVGQAFYSFGWETMLLETGFLAIFFGPAHVAAPIIIIYLYRWLLFRNIFGAGLIKLRGDACWSDLTCLYYYYETQPIPNPLSRCFHYLPKMIHRMGVFFNHIIELIVPFFYFCPAPISYIAGGLTFLFQFVLILSGNLAFLNWLTVLLCIPLFDDVFWHAILQLKAISVAPMPLPFAVILALLTLTIIVLSYRPTLNLFCRGQMMNASFDSLHIVNTYGAFGSVTKVRNEIIVLGANEPEGPWQEYAFKGKPGDVSRMPCLMSPYHFRLDWLMWFAAMGHYSQAPWTLNFITKLLQGDRKTLGLLRENPFKESPPKYIKCDLYRYHFSKRGSSDWWTRRYIGEYLPILSLNEEKGPCLH